MGERSIERLPFGPSQETGWDAVGGAGAEAFNVTIDGRGTVRRRPGIGAYFTTDDATSLVVDAEGITGLYSTTEGQLYATGGGAHSKKLYRLTEGGAAELGIIVGDYRPTFAETQTLLVICAGERIYKVKKADDAFAELGGAPPHSRNVIAHGSRLALLDLVNKGSFHYSAVSTGIDETGFELWNLAPDPRFGGVASASGAFSAEARSDPIVALRENTAEIFAFGSSNVQTFGPDAQSIYAPLSTREFGCSAADGIIKDDQNFAWIDHLRRVVHSDGRTFNFLSDPIKQNLDDMATLADAFGYRLVHGNCDALVWSFPSDGRTFSFQRGGGWSQWGGWNGGHRRLRITAAVQTLDGNRNIVGLDDGRIGVFETDALDDLGEPINAYMTTGFVDHGSNHRKHCRSLRLVLRRGASTGTKAPSGKLEYRDGLGAWRMAGETSLGLAGDDRLVVQFHSLGVYRRRQWRFTYTGSAGLVLAGAEEEYENLGI